MQSYLTLRGKRTKACIRIRLAGVWVSALPLSDVVILGKSLPFSEPQLPHLYNEDVAPALPGWYKDPRFMKPAATVPGTW